MGSQLKTTPLHSWHLSQDANMADFAGFDMPLWYPSGVKAEHFHVLTTAGFFDTSHMACILVEGLDAFVLLNRCFTRDIATLPAQRCIYGAFLNDKGVCVDDAIVYKFFDTCFMVCVNAGMGPMVTAHLLAHQNDTKTVTITDLTGKIAKIDVQGPLSARALFPLIMHPETVFDTFPYFSFKGGLPEIPASSAQTVCLQNGTPVLLSRSGYTGEFGFEMFVPPQAALDLWQALASDRQHLGIGPCGLGARDSLRTGAGLPLSHQDIGNDLFIHHPWEFALPFNSSRTGFTKSFVGDTALLNATDTAYTLPFVGDSLRKIGTGPDSQVLDKDQNVIGTVLSCATDMAIDHYNGKIVSINTPDLPGDLKIRGLSCGFVKVSKNLPPGTPITLMEKKRQISATIVRQIRPDTTARKKLSHFI